MKVVKILTDSWHVSGVTCIFLCGSMFIIHVRPSACACAFVNGCSRCWTVCMDSGSSEGVAFYRTTAYSISAPDCCGTNNVSMQHSLSSSWCTRRVCISGGLKYVVHAHAWTTYWRISVPIECRWALAASQHRRPRSVCNSTQAGINAIEPHNSRRWWFIERH